MRMRRHYKNKQIRMWPSVRTKMILAIVACALFSHASAQESRLVHLAQGPAIGYKARDADVFVFYSIPYATAPTGPQKFKAPLAPPSWDEPFEAVDKGIVCPGPADRIQPGKTVQEDCLIASIYVPDTNATNLPVAVFVHGGAFQMGFGDSVKPKQLVDSGKIIAVTFNYRIGIHGFLCMGTEDIPGNAGMKDQVAILRWVNQNIRQFGGNPDDVTIAGCSAGGASADLLMLSKLTKGLFKKVIALSGANVGLFAIQLDPVEHARQQSRLFNFEHADDFNALEEFYKSAPYELLTSYDQGVNKHSGIVFSPCIEKDLGQDRFLEDTPMHILRSGNYDKYPVLYGFADKEGLIRLRLFDTWKNDMNENFSDFLPVDLTFGDEEERQNVATEIKEFYFGSQPVGDDSVLAYIDYFTDVMFVCAMLRSVTLQVNAGNHEIYLHEYSFVHNNMALIPYTNIRGATHCTQSRAALDEDESIISDEYRHIKTIMREIWLNFIITGNPTPAGSSIPLWLPANAERSPVMSFGQTIGPVDSVIPERARFWDSIYDRYHREPTPLTSAADGLIASSFLMTVIIFKYIILST